MDGSRDTDLVTRRTFATNPWRSNSTGGGGGISNLQVVPYPPADRYGFVDPAAGAKPAGGPKLKTSTSWKFDDPELKRRRRVASYKAYSVEGKVKATLRKSVRWFKDKYFDMRYGWW